MSPSSVDRVILIVLDSVGIGAAPDAARFEDQDANTLGHIGEWCSKNFKSFHLPNLEAWGLGHLCNTHGCRPLQKHKASLAALEELSPGKDTTTGHWEIAGHVLRYEFPVFKDGFTSQIMDQWVSACGLNGYLGNKPSSGTTILDELGEEHIQTGLPIVYTSGDSVFQIACHETHFGLQRLYELCEKARKIVDPLGVGRVIARPFLGERRGEFKRSENRRDYSVPPPYPNLLDIIKESEMMVAGVGKIEDIFAHRGLTLSEHTGRNETGIEATIQMITRGKRRGLIFTNLVDFDQLHGHRRDPRSYAQALMDFDQSLPRLEGALSERDLLIITADHGNDPTFRGSDHTREVVPLLFFSKSSAFCPKNFGSVKGLTTVARLCLEGLGLNERLERLPDACESASLWSR
jgi:phosphopentomutase